jgi:Bifunctional DNA primase/polymerase, N-terminal/AAA domain
MKSPGDSMAAVPAGNERGGNFSGNEAMTTSNGELLQAALSYAARGWRVLPCHPETKRPVTEHGLHDATADPATITQWWSQWPGAMIGVRTGPESGIWAMDLDVANGVNGVEAFYDLAAGRLIPETTKTKTPRGGVHMFFAWADGVKNSAGKLAAGVDTRGEGGYCILPPSQRSDRKCYEPLSDVYPDPPEAPQWLLDLVLQPKADAQRVEAPPRPRATNGSGNAYARAALAAECDRVASAAPGGRNHALNAAAFSLGQLVASGVLDENKVRARLTDAAAGLAKDDGADSVAKTISSGLTAGMQQPRQVPERRQQPRGLPPPQPSPWRFHADADPQLTAWLIKGLLPETGSGLISGQWGSYKTTVALDLAASAMTATPFAGKYIVKRQGGVAYFACEGAGGLASRLTAIARARGATGALPFAYRADCPPLTADGALERLSHMVEDAAKGLKDKFDVPLVLLFVDTIVTAAGYAKAGDENDAAAAQRVMSTLDGLSQRTGALVLGVDHFGKVTDTGTRGSSAKEGAADVVLALLADREINGSVTNTRLAIRKQREGFAGLELHFTPKTVEVGTDQDGEPITRTVIDWNPAPAATADAGWPKSVRLLQRILMTVLVDGQDIQPFPDGPTVRACDLEVVRHEFYKQHPAEGPEKKKAETRRKAFNRAVDDAQARGLIATREIDNVQLVWLATPQG